MTREWDFRGIDPGDEVPDIDTSVPHSARIYDYILGGKDDFAVDRQAAAKAMAANPRFFSGLELLPPGIQLMSHWRPEDEPRLRPAAAEASAYAAIARKP